MKPAEASLPSDTEVLVKRSFDAPVKLVWRAYMEPDLMRRWCSGLPGWSMPVCEMDMRVGGKYRWRWRSDENGQEFGFTGEVLEVTPHAKIVHTQIYDAGDLGGSMGSEPSIITVTFQETNGITNMTTWNSPGKVDRKLTVSGTVHTPWERGSQATSGDAGRCRTPRCTRRRRRVPRRGWRSQRHGSAPSSERQRSSPLVHYPSSHRGGSCCTRCRAWPA